MKIIHTSDIHIGVENYGKIDPITGLSTRLGDFLKSFDTVVDYTIEVDADLFVFSGDAFKTREPTPTQQREFAKRIVRLSKNNIPAVLLVGNHDTPNATGKANSLDIYSVMEIPNTTVIRELSAQTLKTKRGEPIQIIGFPWLSRKEFTNSKEKLVELIGNIDPKIPAIGMVHASVHGAKYGSEQLVMLGGDMVVDKEPWVDPKIQYVALGHIHQHQIIHQNPPMIYSGSLERVDFGEEKEEKVFMDVDIVPVGEKFKASYKKIPTGARKFVSFNIDSSTENPTEEVLAQLASRDTKDCVVKINVNLPHDGNIGLDIEKIHQALKGTFFVAGIHRNILQQKRAQLAENVEQLDPLTALEKYLQSKNFNKDRLLVLRKIAADLMDGK